MPDPRILQFKFPSFTGLQNFQIGFTGDQENWETLMVEGETDLDSDLLNSESVYELDGVNTTDDEDNNGAAASTPPHWYRVRYKRAGKWSNWSEPFVFPSIEDFMAGMKGNLKDPGEFGQTPLLSDKDYRLHVANAVQAFERSHPNYVSQVYDMTSNTQSYPLPDEWSVYTSSITQIEYPVGQVPRRFIQANLVYWDEQTMEWRFRRIYPSEGEQARIYCTARHKRDGSTVPVAFYEAVLMWATGDAAQQIRAKSNQFGDVMMGADYVAIDPRIREWAKIADEWKKQAERMWGSGVTGVRATIDYYEDHGRVPPVVWGG
jgi:hypothetical protein